ncbi:hypothetical protein PF004_g11289 [Phytophthora fragariae]|uniref:Uncharacterized protein n=1 Tax=Phytophthora fragariae TaxID=53985 RepID=A0A6G0NYD6_9STRA|nr:hypothetical protein PF004_g11289 [Phytophthora fragariae]
MKYLDKFDIDEEEDDMRGLYKSGQTSVGKATRPVGSHVVIQSSATGSSGAHAPAATTDSQTPAAGPAADAPEVSSNDPCNPQP